MLIKLVGTYLDTMREWYLLWYYHGVVPTLVPSWSDTYIGTTREWYLPWYYKGIEPDWTLRSARVKVVYKQF